MPRKPKLMVISPDTHGAEPRHDLPPRIAQQLRALDQQVSVFESAMQAAVRERTVYIGAALDLLGVDRESNDVSVDIETCTYTVSPKAPPKLEE